MTSATPATLHFGPSWMREPGQIMGKKGTGGSANQPPTSPAQNSAGANNPSTGSYSSLVSGGGSTVTVQPERRDEAHPFRYSKDDMLKIFKEQTRPSLGLEVERWDGIVQESASGPVSLREISDGEKKVRQFSFYFFASF